MKLGQLKIHVKTCVHFIIFRHVRDSYKTNGRVRGPEETFDVQNGVKRMPYVRELRWMYANKCTLPRYDLFWCGIVMQ